MTEQPEFLLTLMCPEGPGIVHAVSGFLVAHGADIVDNRQYGDRAAGRFFMRVHFAAAPDVTADRLRVDFAPLARTLHMQWEVHAVGERPRLLVMASKSAHCLNDLLYRWRIGALPADIVHVVSNHRTVEDIAGFYGVPFEHVPVTPHTRDAAEQRLLELVDDLGVDLVVLARYMQVLSDETCAKLAGRAINIHHSFLPSFKGAQPYHQAHRRGVKLVGATAHYVTPDLDEGPIIEQEVVRVDHSLGADELAAVGRDVESVTLARAVQWHVERRVLLNGDRTVVFR